MLKTFNRTVVVGKTLRASSWEDGAGWDLAADGTRDARWPFFCTGT